MSASTVLSVAGRRRMDSLSDLPDVYDSQGCDSLLTGYPADEELFCLAMTWPATEVARPGCVWTHSLLLDDAACSIGDPVPLLGLFRRPTMETLETYRVPLAVPEGTIDPPREVHSDTEVMDTILWSVYGQPVQPVEVRRSVLDRDAPSEALIRVWGQQWPALRKVFAFAHAPQTARRVDRRLFNFQVTDRPSSSTWTQPRTAPPLRSVVRPISGAKPRWVTSLANDACRTTDLREYLWSYGADSPATPTSVWALVSIHESLRDPPSLGRVSAILETIASAFPEPDDARSLKVAVIDRPDRSDLPGTLDAQSLLSLVLHTGDTPEFIQADYLRARAKELAKVDLDSAISMFPESRTTPMSPAAQAVTNGVAEAITLADVDRWLRSNPDSFTTFALGSVSFLERPGLWGDGRGNLVWTCAMRAPRTQQRRAAIRGILAAGNANLIREALDSWPETTQELLEATEAGSLPERSISLIGEVHPDGVRSWLRNNLSALNVGAALLQFAKDVQAVPGAILQALTAEPERLNEQQLARLFTMSGKGSEGLGESDAISLFVELQKRPKLSKASRSELASRIGEEVASNPDEQVALLVGAFVRKGWDPSGLLALDTRLLKRILNADETGKLAIRLARCLRGGAEATKAKRDALWRALSRLEGKRRDEFLDLVRADLPWA